MRLRLTDAICGFVDNVLVGHSCTKIHRWSTKVAGALTSVHLNGQKCIHVLYRVLVR